MAGNYPRGRKIHAAATPSKTGAASMVSEPQDLARDGTLVAPVDSWALLGDVRMVDRPPPPPPWLTRRGFDGNSDRFGMAKGRICDQFGGFDARFLETSSQLSGIDATFMKVKDHIEDLNSKFVVMNSMMGRMEMMLAKIEGALEVSKLEVEASTTTRKQQRPPQGWYRPPHLRQSAASTPTHPCFNSGLKELDSDVKMQSVPRFRTRTPTVRWNSREKPELSKNDPVFEVKVPKLRTSGQPTDSHEVSSIPSPSNLSSWKDESDLDVEVYSVQWSQRSTQPVRQNSCEKPEIPKSVVELKRMVPKSHTSESVLEKDDSKLQVEVRPTNSNEVSPFPYASGPPNASFLFDADEYYCNICSINCTFKRYSCKKLLDYDLCLNCFNSGRFGLGVTPLDFTLIKSAKIPSGSVGPQGTQGSSSQQPLVTDFVSTISASPPMTLVLDDKTSPPLTPSIHTHALRGSFGEGQSNSIEDNAENDHIFTPPFQRKSCLCSGKYYEGVVAGENWLCSKEFKGDFSHSEGQVKPASNSIVYGWHNIFKLKGEGTVEEKLEEGISGSSDMLLKNKPTDLKDVLTISVELKTESSLRTFADAQLRRFCSLPKTHEKPLVYQHMLVMSKIQRVVGVGTSLYTEEWENLLIFVFDPGGDQME